MLQGQVKFPIFSGMIFFLKKPFYMSFRIRRVGYLTWWSFVIIIHERSKLDIINEWIPSKNGTL